jgi:hypothetical protein
MNMLGFRGSGTLKKKNSSDGHDDIINTRRYWIHGALMLKPHVATTTHGHYSERSN